MASYRVQYDAPVWERTTAIVEIPDDIPEEEIEWWLDNNEDWVSDGYTEFLCTVESIDSELTFQRIEEG